MKFTRKGSDYFSGPFEIRNQTAIGNGQTGWSLYFEGEWLKDAKTKKELVKYAEQC